MVIGNQNQPSGSNSHVALRTAGIIVHNVIYDMEEFSVIF